MRKTFIIVLWALLLIGMLATYIIFSAISDGKIGYVPPIEELENPNLKFATQVISDDGKVLGTWSLSKENRLYVGYEDLSPNLVHALVATEDVRYQAWCADAEECRWWQYHHAAVGKAVLFSYSR